MGRTWENPRENEAEIFARSHWMWQQKTRNHPPITFPRSFTRSLSTQRPHNTRATMIFHLFLWGYLKARKGNDSSRGDRDRSSLNAREINNGIVVSYFPSIIIAILFSFSQTGKTDMLDDSSCKSFRWFHALLPYDPLREPFTAKVETRTETGGTEWMSGELWHFATGRRNQSTLCFSRISTSEWEGKMWTVYRSILHCYVCSPLIFSFAFSRSKFTSSRSKYFPIDLD